MPSRSTRRALRDSPQLRIQLGCHEEGRHVRRLDPASNRETAQTRLGIPLLLQLHGQTVPQKRIVRLIRPASPQSSAALLFRSYVVPCLCSSPRPRFFGWQLALPVTRPPPQRKVLQTSRCIQGQINASCPLHKAVAASFRLGASARRSRLAHGKPGRFRRLCRSHRSRKRHQDGSQLPVATEQGGRNSSSVENSCDDYTNSVGPVEPIEFSLPF